MKMNRTNTAGRLLALIMTVLLVLIMAACGEKDGNKMDSMNNKDNMGSMDNMGGDDSSMDNEPKNEDEATAMHKDLMAQENAILSANTELWEKVFMAADKGMTMQEDGKNYGDFLLKTIEAAKDQFTADDGVTMLSLCSRPSTVLHSCRYRGEHPLFPLVQSLCTFFSLRLYLLYVRVFPR